MTTQSVALDASRVLLFWIGIDQLPSPYMPLRKHAKRLLRDIRHAASRGGFHKWIVLEAVATLESEPIENRLALVADCLDRAGPWAVYRAFNGLPIGLVPLQPGPGLRGSEVQIRITADVPEIGAFAAN